MTISSPQFCPRRLAAFAVLRKGLPLPRSTRSFSPACRRCCRRHVVFLTGLRAQRSMRTFPAWSARSDSAAHRSFLPACRHRGPHGHSHRLAATAVHGTRSFSPACWQVAREGLQPLRFSAKACRCRGPRGLAHLLAASAVLVVCFNEQSRKVSEIRNAQW
jgi:hypothetical protein